MDKVSVLPVGDSMRGDPHDPHDPTTLVGDTSPRTAVAADPVKL